MKVKDLFEKLKFIPLTFQRCSNFDIGKYIKMIDFDSVINNKHFSIELLSKYFPEMKSEVENFLFLKLKSI